MSNGAATMFASLRQWFYPPEFRIRRTSALDDVLPGSIEELLRHLTEAEGSGGSDGKSLGPVLAEVGTGLWRLRKKMVQPDTNRPHDEMRSAYRHFESVWDVLKQAGLEIRDHTGEPVPETGTYNLKVITYQPTPGLTRERVAETIKPSIYWNGDTLQTGEVIVETPVRST
jgi:hypothetical protein